MTQALAEFTLMTVDDDAGAELLVLVDPHPCLFLRCLTAQPDTLTWVPGHLRALNGGGLAVSGAVSGPLKALPRAPDRPLTTRIIDSFQALYPHTRMVPQASTVFRVLDRPPANPASVRPRRRPAGVWL